MDLFLRLAVISAQVQHPGTPIRQKDVRFLHELLRNWEADSQERAHLPRLHNTQIQRFLDSLALVGLAKANRRGPTPEYTLGRSGYFTLLREIRETAISGTAREFLLVLHIFSAYAERIKAAADARSEFQPLVDVRSLVTQRRARLSAEIRYWKDRVKGGLKVIKNAEARKLAGESLVSVFERVAKESPYELNYQKPMTELLEETTSSLLSWELIDGNQLRINQLWQPRIRMLEAELAALPQ